MGNVEVAYEDVVSVVQMMKGHLIVIGVALVAMIVALIAAKKLQKPLRGLVRVQSLVAFVLIAVLAVNMALTGPLYNTLNVVLSDTGSLDPAHAEASRQVVEKVTNEGVILTQNDGGFLPLSTAATPKLNVFGWASTNPIYGGTGSGTVDASTAVGILQGLQNAGFETNSELSQMYVDYRSDRPAISINNGQDWTLPEIPAADYSDSVIQNAKDFSDTAVLVIARSGGEGADLPHDMGAVLDGTYDSERDVIAEGSYWQGTKYTNALYRNNGSYDDFEAGQHYLELSRTEKDLVDLVTSNFDDVILVYNGANMLELDWVANYPQIKSVLLCAGAGATGFNALGNIISGEVNPSGKTADTWLKDLTQAPWYNNIGHFAYNNVEDVTTAAKAAWERADGIVSFVRYVEGIYMGYRFYETANDVGMAGFNYDDVVMYPFGYGLSYTTFSQEMGTLNVSGTTATVDVAVTNTGSTAGKDVVELYYTPPYTEGGIEKASVNLVAFDKTDLLEPGQTQTLTLTFELEDMASYDTNGTGGYLLEAGDYVISLRTDSHTVVDSQTYTVASDVTYGASNLHNGDLIAAENRFGFAAGDVTYLSRANGFANFAQATAAPADFAIHETVQGNGTYDPTVFNDANDVMPTTGAKNGLELFDLRGADYDDPRWEQLLDQVTVSEMVDLIAFGGHQNGEVDSVKKIRVLDTDGPAGVNSSTLGAQGTGYCSEIIVAQTWNEDLAEEMARVMGDEFADFHITGWYAPSMNMHRSAFGGRDFEYYSEDSLLSTKMAVAETRGILDAGMYPFIKHFALNEQETNRNALLCTWTNEQAMREIYFKPFEACIKTWPDGKLAVMSSYNFIGTQWAGGCSALLKDVLRGEWGFKGMVLSDYFGNYGYMDADRAVRGGTDIMLGTAGNEAIMTDQTSATSVLAMRQATKNIFYTTVNSTAYENYTPGSIPGWLMTTYIVDGVIAAALVVLEIFAIRGYMKKKNQNSK